MVYLLIYIDIINLIWSFNYQLISIDISDTGIWPIKLAESQRSCLTLQGHDVALPRQVAAAATAGAGGRGGGQTNSCKAAASRKARARGLRFLQLETSPNISKPFLKISQENRPLIIIIIIIIIIIFFFFFFFTSLWHDWKHSNTLKHPMAEHLWAHRFWTERSVDYQSLRMTGQLGSETVKQSRKQSFSG